MSDVFDSTILTREKINEYIQKLLLLHENVLSNISDGLDANLTIMSYNETLLYNFQPDNSKMMGMVEYQSSETHDFSYNYGDSVLHNYIKHITIEMLREKSWVELLGLDIVSLLHLPFSQFRAISKIVNDYSERRDSAEQSQEDKLQKENEKLKEQLMSINNRINSKQ